jgi:hypothetical protein
VKALALVALLPSLTAAQDIPKPGHKVFEIRLPTWEIMTMTTAQNMVGETRKLRKHEIDEAKKVFKDCVDFDAVRVGPQDVVITDFHTAWGNLIRISPTQKFEYDDLIHELVHVWQYQTGGSSYISDSMLHQTWSFIKTKDRSGAYSYKEVKVDAKGVSTASVPQNKSFYDFTAEQQAQLVEEYYKYPAFNADPVYQRLIAEMVRLKGLKGAQTMFLERAAGLGPREKEIPALQGFEKPWNASGAAPLVELRFDFL